MIYAASDYFGTGEGSTVCLLVTKAYGVGTELEIAEKEFSEHFGAYFASGIEFFTEEEFFDRFSNYLPAFFHDVIRDGAGNINYKMQLHLNFS